MKRIFYLRLACNITFIFAAFHAIAQERVTSLGYNPLVSNYKATTKALSKTTAATLPFFEDFTGYGVFPDNSRWLDHEVYVNNTMCQNAVSRGVATFDALNGVGYPYNPVDPFVVIYADSLTSVQIDLSTHNPGDSIYMSFFYQPQGNGFSPELGDSLLLYFKKKYGIWTKVWAKEGSTSTPFKQVMIAVNDTAYFNDEFQFRFVNIASINLNDDVWNVDYIRMNTGRNINDTAINDVATTLEPFYLLNDLTYMPYRQFLANVSGERATTQAFRVRNNYAANQNISYGYTARETTTNTPLGNGTGTANIPAKTEQQFSFPVYTNTIPSPGNYDKVVFENKYFFAPVSGADPRENDTIVRNQIFDNYLAYDDGTAEKSYYLNLFPTLPGKIAIEYHLNQADTLRGVAIYFGRQVPVATQKYFSVFVNKDIAVNGGTEQPIYQEDLLIPGYADTANHFYIYKLAQPQPLSAGTFYIGTIQPALSGSDSLYIGLDVNRLGGNHLYYNVLNQWESSTISGALMIRPILGQPITGTGVSSDHVVAGNGWKVFPNPAQNFVYIDIPGSNKHTGFEITDIDGKVVLGGTNTPGVAIDISSLCSGVYLCHLKDGIHNSAQKIIKL